MTLGNVWTLHTIGSNSLKAVHCNALCMHSVLSSGEHYLLNINGMLIKQDASPMWNGRGRSEEKIHVDIPFFLNILNILSYRCFVYSIHYIT